MQNLQQFYINGEWVEPQGQTPLTVINPATEQGIATIRLGSQADVDQAVAAAVDAFEHYAHTPKTERIALLERIIQVYEAHADALADAISAEMGAPLQFARKAQVAAGLGHLKVALSVLKKQDFTEVIGTTQVVREPVGVCAMITPWNWPLNQITCKVAPALASGCTMVLKPSEVAPLSAHLFAKILDEAGVPAGVFNLVDGDGAGVGSALSQHPRVDMVSFTGSTRAGRLVAQAAAATIKKVSLELGGKSANILLDDADFEKAVSRGVKAMMSNTGQSCNALSRMLVPASRLADVETMAVQALASIRVGDPQADDTVMGPVVSEVQWQRIQQLIDSGIKEGAKLLAGGTGKPAGLETGYYVKPTLFSEVSPEMTIANEEIFGPVLCIMPYQNLDEAITLANQSDYGLSGGVWSADLEKAKQVAAKLRTGMVHLNGAMVDARAPFGGYKQSGLGREWGKYGFEEFLETKALFGAISADM